MIKVHIGSGGDMRSGWDNVDLFPPATVWDLSKGLPPHYSPDSVDFIFSQHFLEHLTRAQALTLIIDCRKKLKIGGVMRLTVPDLDVLIRRYVENDLPTGGVGAYCPPNRCRMMNDAFSEWGHKYQYNIEELTSLFLDAGFSNMIYPIYKESDYPELCNIETRPFDDLRIEAVKT